MVDLTGISRCKSLVTDPETCNLPSRPLLPFEHPLNLFNSPVFHGLRQQQQRMASFGKCNNCGGRRLIHLMLASLVSTARDAQQRQLYLRIIGLFLGGLFTRHYSPPLIAHFRSYFSNFMPAFPSCEIAALIRLPLISTRYNSFSPTS